MQSKTRHAFLAVRAIVGFFAVLMSALGGTAVCITEQAGVIGIAVLVASLMAVPTARRWFKEVEDDCTH